MRGSPLIHLLLLATAFVLLSVPLRHLTGAVTRHDELHANHGGQVISGVDEHPDEEHTHRVPVRIRIRFAHPPEALALLAGERDLLKGATLTGSPVECEAELEIGHEGSEFILEARWKEGTPGTAVTVELEPDGLETRRETRWSQQDQISDVLTFIW